MLKLKIFNICLHSFNMGAGVYITIHGGSSPLLSILIAASAFLLAVGIRALSQNLPAK